jgi:sortase B
MEVTMGKKRLDLPFLILLCVSGAAILACAAYLIYNYVYLPADIDKQNARYEALYQPQASGTPGTQPTPAPTQASTPAPTGEADVADIPLRTSDPDTIVYAIPTPPPVQGSFSALLDLNPETVGFLTIGDLITLPVAQRQNDNEYYLKHNFEGAESQQGCLFLDGVNRLALSDKLLIVYGHNMKNGTMFGRLTNFEFKSVMRKYAVISFDTIYENRLYVPFACFALTADSSETTYLELRKFQFTQSQFDDYVTQLRKRSLLDVPVDVQYGDDVLLLVTCNYSVDDGRFCVAFRKLRDGESAEDAQALVEQAVEK